MLSLVVPVALDELAATLPPLNRPLGLRHSHTQFNFQVPPAFLLYPLAQAERAGKVTLGIMSRRGSHRWA